MTTFGSLGLGRTLDAGVNVLFPTDVQLSVITANGIVYIYLPSISSILQGRSNSGNLQNIQFILADISNNASVNNIVLYASAGETINGSSSLTLNTNGVSILLTPTSNLSWSAISSNSGGSPTPPPFNSPFDFFLDAAAPSGGDGSIEFPFNTITALNNAVLALANPTQGYVANVAPSDTGYGSEVVGSLAIAPNLNLVGQTPQNTSFSCNITLTSPASGAILQYRNLAFNGIFTIDLSLAAFASVSFQNGVTTINRIDSNPAAFVSLSAGVGASTLSGTILIENAVVLGDVTINDGSNVFAANSFMIGGKFKLNGNSTLKTLSTLNPSSGYVDGTVNVSGTPSWVTDGASDADYTGTLNKTIFDWKVGGNSNHDEQPIGTLNNFDFPIVVNGIEIARFTTDKRLFINDTKTNNGSNNGLQYSSLTANRAGLRTNQYGANNSQATVTSFKSRGTVIGEAITPAVIANNVIVGDILQGFTAIGLTDNGAGVGLIPLAYTQRVIVVQNANGSVACDWEVSLCPLNGATNSIRKAFGFTSEGIQKCLESANGMAGVATLDGTGTVVIPNTNVKATTRFMITVQDGGTAPTGNVYQSARTIGTDFTIKSNAGAADAGVQVYYQLYEPLT